MKGGCSQPPMVQEWKALGVVNRTNKQPGIYFSEVPKYLPFFHTESGRLIIVSNRSLVLGVGDSRILQLGIQFIGGTWHDTMDCCPLKSVRCRVKNSGSRLWVVLDNIGDKPQVISWRMPLVSLITSLEYCGVPDLGLRKIPVHKTPPLLKWKERFQAAELSELVEKHKSLFQDHIGCTSTFLVDDLPLACDLPRFSQPLTRSSGPSEEKLLRETIQHLLDDGVISQSKKELPTLIPIFGIPKKSGKVRIVLDFRYFNKCCIAQPFSRVNRLWTFSEIGPYQVGSQFDIRDSFFQVPLSSKIRENFGFRIGAEYFYFNRLPQGWVNSPHHFLRALSPTVAKVNAQIRGKLFTYMDDLLLLGQDTQSHVDDLKITFNIFAEDGWIFNRDKCKFLRTQFEFLGFTLSPKGWTPGSDFVQKLEDMTLPSTIHQWRSFKGWLQQLTPFLQDGSSVWNLVCDLEIDPTKKKWAEFMVTLKQHIISLQLHEVGQSDVYYVGVDASTYGWGCTLIHNKKLLGCCSGLWNPALRKKLQQDFRHSNELESEALVKALRTFRPWLWGRVVIVHSDNKSVVSFSNPDNCSNFVRRRLHAILDICPQIRFVSGVSNILPDFLSRCAIFGVHPPQSLSFLSSADLDDYHWGHLHAGHASLLTMLHRARSWGFVVSRETLLHRLKHCKICQRTAVFSRRTPLLSAVHATAPGMAISLDYLEPIGGQYLLVILDQFSRVVSLTVAPRATASVARRAGEAWVTSRGPVQVVQTDGGKHFLSRVFTEWVHEVGARHVISPPYDHRANGLVERCHQTILRILRALWLEGKHSRWQDLIPEVEWCMNNTYHRMIGMLPDQLWSANKQMIAQVNNRLKTLRDKLNTGKYWPSRSYQLHEAVWVYKLHLIDGKRFSKLEAPWDGPCYIEKVLSKHLYLIRDTKGTRRVVHFDLLRKYY